MNIRGLQSNYINLLQFLKDTAISYDCILLSEAWISNQNQLIDKDIEGYDIFYSSSGLNKASGVILYIKNNTFNKIVLNQNKSLILDYLHISLSIDEITFSLILIYRSPSLCPKISINELQTRLSDIKEPNGILAGDFNFDISPKNINNFGCEYLSLMGSMGLSCLSKQTTRSTPSHNSCIDHIFYRDKNIIVDDHQTLKLDFSDHYGIEFKIKPLTYIFTNNQATSKINFNLLNKYISQHNWDVVFEIEDTEILTSKLTT